METVTAPAPVIEDFPVAPAERPKRPKITRDDIRSAFTKTGLTPVAHAWGDGHTNACAITALAVAAKSSSRLSSLGGKYDLLVARFGVSPSELDDIIRAWDSPATHYRRSDYPDLLEEVYAARKTLLGY